MFGKNCVSGAFLCSLAAFATAAMAADPEPTGAAFKINAATLGDAEGAPDVALSAGGFIAVWEGEDDDGKGIYARGFDPKGEPWGSAQVVNTTTVGYQEKPAIASRHNGNFVIVWQGRDAKKGELHVYARSFTFAGVPLSGEVVVDVAEGRTPSAPAVAVAPGGDFLVVWQSLDGDPTEGTGEDVFGRLFEDDGTPITGETKLNGIDGGDQTDPAVAAMAAETSTGFYVVWKSDDTDEGDIYLQHLDLAGKLLLQSEAQVNTPAEIGVEQRDPAVAVSAIGPEKGSLNRVAVVWEGPHADGQRIWYRLFDLEGEADGGENVADTASEALAQRSPAVALPAVAPEGLVQLVVTYTQVAPQELLGAPCLIVGARRPWTHHNLLADDPTVFPLSAPGPITGASRIAMDGEGGFVAVWQSEGPKGTGIDLYARRYAPAVFTDGFEGGSTARWSQLGNDEDSP